MAGRTKRTKRHKKIEKRNAERKRDKKINEVLEKADTELSKLYRQERTTPYKIGELFKKVKEEVGHGNWLAWLKDKQYTSDSTANSYMAISETFSSAEEAGLFSIAQQGKLTCKKLRKEQPGIVEEMVKRAEEGERWTNQQFKDELNKLQSTPRNSSPSVKDSAESASMVEGKSDQERWIDHVEGLVSSIEAAKGDYEWAEDESTQVKGRIGSIRRRLRTLSDFFKSTTVGDLAAIKRIYAKKHYKGRRHGRG